MLPSNIVDILSLSGFQGNRARKLMEGSNAPAEGGKGSINPLVHRPVSAFNSPEQECHRLMLAGTDPLAWHTAF